MGLTYRLDIFMERWSYADSEQRSARAKVLAQYGISPIPTVIAGDKRRKLPTHLPDIDWNHVPMSIRGHKGRQRHDGTWCADTRVVDRLIGAWDTSLACRQDGAEYHHVAELDPQAPNPLAGHR